MTVSRCLLIDDNRDFLPATIKLMRDQGVAEFHVARTPAEAFALLEQYDTWTAVWFDHDLGTVNNEIVDVMPVVNYITQHADKFTFESVFVHTTNPSGGDNIMRALKSIGYAPQRLFAGEYLHELEEWHVHR